MLSKEVLLKRCFALLLACVLSTAMLAGCSSGENSGEAESTTEVESTAEAEENADNAENAENSEAKDADSVEVKTISPDDIKATIDAAKPYEGEVQVSVEANTLEKKDAEGGEAEGEDTLKFGEMDVHPYKAAKSGAGDIVGVYVTSTLHAGDNNYSVWNMLDWDAYTCWAEGNPHSKGVNEGFGYEFRGKVKIDGFTIAPGYQKSRRVYRNNYLPEVLYIEAGGRQFTAVLDEGLQDLSDDNASYCINIFLDKPVYADTVYVMIGAVGTYGRDPDPDCCITEFHPFCID